MVKITDLPTAQTPLDPADLTFVFQDGQLKSVNQAQFGFSTTVAAELQVVTDNIAAIDTVATNIAAIQAVDFQANTVTFDPTGLTYLTAVNLETLGQQIDAQFGTVYSTITADLANYGLRSGTLAQFNSTTSAQLAGVISDETGTGALVFASTPTLSTPVLGVASATSINKVAITAPASGATLTIADGSTLTVSSNATVSNTNTGDQTLSDATISTSDITTNNVSITKHGFAPKAPNDATKYLDGTGAYTVPAGSGVTDATISTSDVTTNNVTSTKHGWAPKSPNDSAQFLNGAATPAFAQIKESDLAFTDVTTNNVSATKHGYTPKTPNDVTKFLDGTGNWSAPIGGSGSVTSVSVTTANGVSGSVATATSTPAITLTLGNITPTTVNKTTITAPATGSTLTIDDGFTLHASGNATISGTNTGDQNLFGSIPVSGQTTVTPSSTATALTLAAGANMTITTNNATKTITFASSGGGGGATLADGNYGDVTASGSGTTITINANAVTNADLAGSIAASKFVGTDIATVGTITAGTWHGTKVGLAYGGTNADLSATGGTSQVLKQTSVGGNVSVAQLAASDLSNSTTGSNEVVLKTSPTLVTPVLGAATATSVNKVAITAPATSSTLTIDDGFTLHANGNSTVSGTNTGDQTITLTGNVTGSGTGSFAATIASSVALAGSPTTTTQASTDNTTKIATTAFVTTAVANAVAGINPAVAVEVASAAILPNSPTYSNGASGVGATITSSTLSALVVDGYTVGLNEAVLVKNESGGSGLGAAKNGVYTLTTLGVAAVTAWVLTRRSDYNTASEMNESGIVPVKSNGTANKNTSWLLETTVTTVGTDVLTYGQFSYDPAVTALTTSTLAQFANTTSAQLAGIITDETGTNKLVFSDSPTLVTPLLGTPTSGNLSNCTAYPIASVANLASGVATFLTTPSSANLISAVTDETGTGALVFATSPALVTPLLGTPTSGNLSNCTAYPVASVANLGTGVATFLTTPSSANFAAAITDETGTAGSVVFSASPALTGSPTAPTQALSDNSTKIATTAYINQAVGAVYYTQLGAF